MEFVKRNEIKDEKEWRVDAKIILTATMAFNYRRSIFFFTCINKI